MSEGSVLRRSDSERSNVSYPPYVPVSSSVVHWLPASRTNGVFENVTNGVSENVLRSLSVGPSMQTWDAITSRRNVRSFTDQPVSAEHLDRILEAGRRAPSSRNTQPWDFVLVTDRDQLRGLSNVWVGAGHLAGAAAAVAMILSDDPELARRAQFDLGQATMSMMLAAADLGIGSGHAGVSDQAMARGLLGLPADRTCAFLISLGYPADRSLAPIARPDRRPFDEVVHRGRW
jgi:nitroreductase